VVSQKITDLIKEIQKEPLFKDHILVGGTALALQLDHRTSTDIDLFTTKTQSAVDIINFFNKNFKNVSVETGEDKFTRIFVNGIKIELVEYNEKLIEEPINKDGIKLVDLNELAAMKLEAMRTRTEARDFIDIAYLLKEIPLEKMFELYKKKFDTISPLYMKRTLLNKSKSIKDNEWLVGGIIMLNDDIKPKDVPIFIEKAIEKYNNDKNIVIQNNPLIDSLPSAE
jgi:hypothetical protein